MWTEEQRRIYRREVEGYSSDLRDAEWARLEPMLAPAQPGGRPRKTEMRAVMNAILYLLRTGCRWRYLPQASLDVPEDTLSLIRELARLMPDQFGSFLAIAAPSLPAHLLTAR